MLEMEVMVFLLGALGLGWVLEVQGWMGMGSTTRSLNSFRVLKAGTDILTSLPSWL